MFLEFFLQTEQDDINETMEATDDLVWDTKNKKKSESE